MNGIGGRTIEEAQRNVSVEEFTMWAQYRNKRGPMNPGHQAHIAAFALFVANVRAAQGAKDFNLYDIFQFIDEPEITAEQAMKEWA